MVQEMPGMAEIIDTTIVTVAPTIVPVHKPTTATVKVLPAPAPAVTVDPTKGSTIGRKELGGGK